MGNADTYGNYIGGQWVPAMSGETFENRNPSRISEVLGYFPRSSHLDVKKAVEAAQEAFVFWREMSPPQRGEILIKTAQILESQKKKLAQVISRENGKTVKSALGEVQTAIDTAYYMAGEGRRMFGKTTHSSLKKRFAMTKRYPIGVVGIILPFNFPMALASWRIFPALICGNTVVVKSDENSPETLVHLVKALESAGLPKGVLNVVHGYGSEVGEPLTLHPQVELISFTGSSATGKRVAQNCISRNAKVSLELGGKNAVIVMEDAALDLAVDGVVCGAFSVSGQRCTATGRVLVHRQVYTAFMEKLLAKIASYKVGPAWEDTSDVTPLIHAHHCDRVMGFIERAKQAGATVQGGIRLQGGDYDSGYYISPAVVDGVSLTMEIVEEEVFGPVLVVIPIDSYEEAVRIHNQSQYGLSASLFTSDINRAMSFFDDIQTGVCYINAPTFGSELHLPFGGDKNSGRGHREVGWAAVEVYTEQKTLYIDYSNKIQNAQFVDKK